MHFINKQVNKQKMFINAELKWRWAEDEDEVTGFAHCTAPEHGEF